MSNYSLQYDLQTCQQYGTSVIALPETNVNWSLPEQREIFFQLQKRTWGNSACQTSWAKENFLSLYQPGGTATIVCERWTSRNMARGKDPLGLGRWSYVILRGKGYKKIAVITAYNVGPSRGDTMANQQQHILLSAHIRQHNLPVSPHSHRQFILDLQSWIEAIIKDGHEIILAMDANEAYNPDVNVTPHPLTHQSGKITLDKKHDGKLATLISTCGLKDPLAVQHHERPFPPSYFRGQNRIDYILVTPQLMSSVIRSGSLPFYSIFQGDHRPY